MLELSESKAAGGKLLSGPALSQLCRCGPGLCWESTFPWKHRIPAWSGLEGTSVGHLVQPAAEAGSPTAGWVFNISREGDSTTSLGSLFQCSVTLRGKKFFLVFRRNFLCFSLCPLPLVLSLGTTEKSLAPSS